MWKWFGCCSPKCCAKDMSDLEGRRPMLKSNTFTNTAETAEEAMMETATVPVETEQPRLTASPGLVEAGSGQQESKVKVAEVAGAKGAQNQMEGDDSSVDKCPSVDLTPLKESENLLISENGDDNGCLDSVSDKPENLDNEKTGSVERLSDLAKQIDDFDPCSMLDKPKDLADGNPAFSRDINEEKLIDELIDKAVNASYDEQDNDNDIEDTRKDKNSDIDSEREVTPDDLDNFGDSKDESKLATDVTLSNVEDMENGEEKPSNGSMSVSSESEGIQEEQEGKPVETGQDEPEDERCKVTVKADAPAVKPGNKVETQKTENASPTKTVKSKKKEDKSIEHILKALSSLQSTEEKLAALCKKYADLHEEHRILQGTFKQSQRKLTVISREKDQLQTEHTKAVMAKSKLESLCRELQKHNSTIRQESLQRAKEEDEKRKEISQKFQTTIGEIQTQMQENHERNKQLREENFDLANKLKKFIEQYEVREKQVEKVIHHRELEQKLADAKLAHANAILLDEQGKSQKEKEMLILQATEYMKKNQLKDAELKMYKERYEEFQSTIKKSEEMFTKFKTEMDKMTKRCKKLEKDGVQWRSKWENANRALLEMAEDRTKYDKERGLLMSKVSKLESLCRAMQAERQARKMLETEGVDMSKLSLSDSIPPPQELSDAALSPTSESPTPGDTESPTPRDTESPTPGDTESPTPGDPESPTPGDNADVACEDTENTSEVGSSASEQTGVTVIQHDSTTDTPPVDTSQSKCEEEEIIQSETPQATNVEQSGTSTADLSNQTEVDPSNVAS